MVARRVPDDDLSQGDIPADLPRRAVRDALCLHAQLRRIPAHSLCLGRDQTLPLAIYGTFSVEIHPNIFAFGVMTTLFSFALLSVYGILMALSVRRAKKMAMQEDIA